jgi:sulfur carrier protein
VTFQLNGEAQQAEAPLSVRSLLERLELRTRRVAVAINKRVVPRSRFDEILVEDGDRVEVIHAVGGG